MTTVTLTAEQALYLRDLLAADLDRMHDDADQYGTDNSDDRSAAETILYQIALVEPK